MKIGIIVHSQTGNTLSVARQLREKLCSDGHEVTLAQVVPVDERAAKAEIVRFRMKPDAGAYDALVFGAPVRGASLSPAMAAYLAQCSFLAGKITACYVTEFFPFPWMGGNRAVAQMKTACAGKGCDVRAMGIVNWSSGRRQKMIDDIVGEISGLF